MIKARKTDSRMSRKRSRPCSLGIEGFLFDISGMLIYKGNGYVKGLVAGKGMSGARE